jgi:hypothetical protein
MAGEQNVDESVTETGTPVMTEQSGTLFLIIITLVLGYIYPRPVR